MSLTIDSAPFIKVVKQLIKQKNLTQTELAEKSGLSRPQLSRLLSGKNKRVQQSTVDKITAALDLTEQEFSETLSDKQVINKPQNLPSTIIYSDRLPTVVGQFIGRTAELDVLDQAWANADINILQFIAPGGTGKTKLLREWINTRRDKITSMIAWSFYSQGASADKQISTSPFFDHALSIFDAQHPTFASDEDKGDYVAKLLRDNQCLLILDGLEPLQHADAANRGELKDRALARLLKNLAGQSGTFCVITSRVAVYELSDRATVETHNLQNLKAHDGVALLQSLGVEGKGEALLKAVGDYAGHALALSLLGNFLRLRYRGDISKLETLPNLLQANGDKTSRHAFKVMQAYEDWFEGTPELSLLYILGLFDHPVEIEVLEALWNTEITGLTDRFQKAEWLSAIDSLRHDHRILADFTQDEQSTETAQTLDCHPLIREYFGGQLEDNKPEIWQAAHECLYEYYKAAPEKELPATLEEMRPLFHAVRHGCTAELTQSAFVEVFWDRIERGTQTYLNTALKAYSDELSVIINFFSQPWSTLKEGLHRTSKNLLISLVPFDLNLLGRAQESLQPSTLLLEVLTKQEKWGDAVKISLALSRQQLILGHLSSANDTARHGIEYADNTEDTSNHFLARVVYSNVLYQTGDTEKALKILEEAKVIDITKKAKLPFISAIWDHHLLFTDFQQLGELNEDAEDILQWRSNRHPYQPISSAEKLNLGQIFLSLEDYPKATESLRSIASDLYDDNRKDLIINALFIRATLYRETSDFSKAHRDLQDAYSIALIGNFRLYLTDYHLEMARLLLKQWQQQLLDDSAQAEIQNHIASAVKLINETGYHRRDAEVEALIGPSQTTQHKQKKWSEEW